MDNSVPLKICTNTDTGLLKVAAFFTMLIDHAGYVFFPDCMLFRIIGRIAFPIFAYCLVVGFIYTKSVKKYAARLMIFAAVSQPFYVLAFYPDATKELFDPGKYSTPYTAVMNILENLHFNIGFTLLLGLAALYGIKSKRYLLVAFSVILSLFENFEYSIYGLALIILMYLFISSTKENFALVLGAFMFMDFFIGGFYEILGMEINPQGFAILALPLLTLDTKSNIKIPRLINYGFYPFHIAAIFFIKLWLQ